MQLFPLVCFTASQWQYGAEYTTVEEMEAGFQYLLRSGSTTKNMTRPGLYST